MRSAEMENRNGLPTTGGLGLVRRFADCFIDRRAPHYVEHQVETLVDSASSVSHWV